MNLAIPELDSNFMMHSSIFFIYHKTISNLTDILDTLSQIQLNIYIIGITYFCYWYYSVLNLFRNYCVAQSRGLDMKFI